MHGARLFVQDNTNRAPISQQPQAVQKGQNAELAGHSRRVQWSSCTLRAWNRDRHAGKNGRMQPAFHLPAIRILAPLHISTCLLPIASAYVLAAKHED